MVRLLKPLRAFGVTVFISIGVTAFILLLTQDALIGVAPIRRAELSLIDHRFQERSNMRILLDSSSVVIVEISLESDKSLPVKWPLPKSYYARLIRNLNRAGARAIGIDLLFNSPDVRDPAGDEIFRRTIHEAGNVVLAGELDTDQRYYTVEHSGENYGNIFFDSSTAIGLVNTRSDADGVLRRYMPFGVDPARDIRLPTFAMAMLNVYFRHDHLYTVSIEDDHFSYLDRTIPRYDGTSFLINYYGHSGTFHRMKLADILDDREFQTVEELTYGEEINTFDDEEIGYLNTGVFRDKIVIVGSTTPQDKDLFPVPIGEGRQVGDNQMYGVEIHASVIQSILDRNFIERQSIPSTAAVVFILSFFTFAFTASLKAIKARLSSLIEILGVAIILAELFILYSIALSLFIEHNYLLDMMSPFLAIVVSYVGSTIYNYVTERKQKAVIKNMFSHYVNRDVVNELVDDPAKLRLSGDRREMTVMFTDIENFTTLAERMRAEELVKILNDYLNEMTAIVFRNRGTVDKFEGDAIMAFWGAPVPQPDHPLLACRTAVEMQRALVEIRKEWTDAGRSPINVRIGINTGEMIVGNIGGSGKFEYTVIGDSVNLGSRLESANKQYRTNIMMSEATYRRVAQEVIARELDMLVVAGKTEPIRVYELIGLRNVNLSSDRTHFLEHYANGLSSYRRREWTLAIDYFKRALEIDPADYPSQIYIERSHLYHVSPPLEDWDGTFILRKK